MSEDLTSEDLENSIRGIADFVPNRDEIARLIADFGAHIGVSDLELTESGEACIVLDDGLVVSLFHDGNLPRLVAASPMPETAAQNEMVLRGLLKANMSWAHTHGGTFATAPESAIPMLLCQIPLTSLDVETLDRYLTDFVEFVRVWHGDIKTTIDGKDEAMAERSAEKALPGSLV